MDIPPETDLTTAVKEAEEKCSQFYTQTLTKFLEGTQRTKEEASQEGEALLEETLNLFCVLLHEKGHVVEDAARAELESSLASKLRSIFQAALTKLELDGSSLRNGQEPNCSLAGLGLEINMEEKYFRRKYSIEVEQLDGKGRSETTLFQWSICTFEPLEEQEEKASKSKL